jgi:hypothetical protein
MITYNTKCIIQGFFVLGVWAASYKQLTPNPDWDESPAKTGLFALFLFWIVYVMNAVLDLRYGCDHGTIYDSFK